MLWKALHTNSLWANFFRAKYIGQNHLRDVHFHNMNGLSRRSWLTAKNLVLKYHKVIIGDGKLTNFWYDHWIGNQCLANFVPANSIQHPHTTVNSFLRQPSSEDMELLERSMPATVKIAVLNTTLSLDDDFHAWSRSASGACSVASTYQAISENVSNQSVVHWERLWSNWLPTKISIHLWKILHNSLPVDSNIQRIGVNLCSACSCCQVTQRESMNHLFLHSDLASNIWSHFSSAGLPLEGNSITAFIYNAANSAQPKSAYGLLTLAVIGYGCWNIWRARNSMRYEEKILHKRRVLYQTLSQVKTVCVNANLKEDDACK